MKVSKPKQTKRVGNDNLKPLSDEERKQLFPNGPMSLKNLKELKNKIVHNQKLTTDAQTFK